MNWKCRSWLDVVEAGIETGGWNPDAGRASSFQGEHRQP
jgi:hypothetical protein